MPESDDATEGHLRGGRPAPAPGFAARGLRYYWYRIGRGHVMGIVAADEEAARRAILARHPHARGQRLTITAWED